MLPIGTQVSVVMSTANKKLSPRCGSVGYVSGIGTSKFLSKDFSNGLITTPINIIFTKYGNENKFRKEKRVILNIIPIETQNNKQDTEANIKKLKDSFNKKHIFLKEHVVLNGATCAGTVIPNNTFRNITENSRIETEAWVQSYMMHYYFNTALARILKQLKYSPKFIVQLLKDYSKLELKEVILALRSASTIYNVRNYANYLIAFRRALTKGITNQNEFFNMYVKDLFDKGKSIEKEEMVKKYANNKSQCITISNINKTSVALIKLNHSKGA